MGFKDDALEYVQHTAREIWTGRQDKRDDYVSRSLEPYEGDQSDDEVPFRRASFDDESLIEEPRIAVIGSSASGKSYLIDYVYGQSLDRFEEREGDAPFPIYVDCGGGLPRSNSIEEAIRLGSAGDLYDRISDEHRPGVHLFLDEVDTRLRRDSSFRFDLIQDLQKIEEEVGNLQLMLTSRRREWERLSKFKQKVDAGKIQAVQFPSRPASAAYEHLIPDHERLEAFFETCYQRGFRDLLDLPMEGFELARTYERTGELPESRDRLQLTDRLIDERLVKSDSEEELISAPPRRRLRYLAGLLACISFFCERRAWSVRDAINDLGETALVGEIQPVTSAEVKWLIQSRLFHSIDSNRYTFSNNRFREALAAETLAQLKPRKQRCLLRAGRVHGQEHVIPAARSVAVNLATLDPRYLEHLRATEPEIAAFSVAAWLGRAEKQDVIERFAEWGRRGHHPPWTELQGVGEPARIALGRHRDALTPDFVLRYLTSGNPMERLWGVVMAQYAAVEPSVCKRLLDITHAEWEATGTRKRALEALERGRDPSYATRIEPLLQHDDDEIRGCALTAWRKLSSPSPAEYVQQLDKPRANSSLYGRLVRDPQEYTETLTAEQVTEAFEAIKRRDQIAEEEATAPGTGLNDVQRKFLRGLLERTSKLEDVQVSVDLLVSFFAGNSWYPTDSEAAVEALKSHAQLWWDVLSKCLANAEEYVFNGHELTKILARSLPDDFGNRIPVPDDGGYQTDFLEQLSEAIDRLDAEQDSIDFRLAPLFGSTREDRSPPEKPMLSDEEPLPPYVEPADVNERIQTVLDGCSDTQDCAQALMNEFWRINAGKDPAAQTHRLRVASLKPEHLSQLIRFLQSDLRSKVVRTLREGLPVLSSSDSVARPLVACLLDRGERVEVDTLSSILIDSRFWGDDSRSGLEARLLEHLRELDRKDWKDTVDRLMTRPDARRKVLAHLIDEEEGFYVENIEDELREASYKSYPEWLKMVAYVKSHTEGSVTDILVDAYRAVEKKSESSGEQETGEPIISRTDRLDLLVDIIESGDERGWELLEEGLSNGALPLQKSTPEVRVPEPDTSHHVDLLAEWYRQVRVAKDDLSPTASENRAHDYDVVAQAIMDQIVGHGSAEAVDAVFSLQQSNDFTGAQWLSFKCLDVIDEYLSNKTGSYSIRELLEFILTDLFHLIRSEGDLFEVLLQVLEDLQRDFEEGRAVAGFWNPVSKDDDAYSEAGSNSLAHVEEPKDETDCQNVLWGLVRPRLRAYGVTDIEENFVGKNRADLRLDYVEAGRRAERVFLELKVAHKGYTFGPDTQNNLFDPIENQLLDRYLRPTGVKHGIYAVIWPKDPERYAWPRYSSGSYGKRYESSEAFQQALSERADAVNREYGVAIETVVLDITTEYR